MVQGRGQRQRFFRDLEQHLVAGGGNVIDFELGDPGGRLGVKENEQARDAIGGGNGVVGEQAADQGDPLSLGLGVGSDLGRAGDAQPGAEALPDGKGYEGAGQLPCGRPAGEPAAD
jgi:hypothetical protein